MYPKEKQMENQLPYEEQIHSVQNAVDQFRKDEGGILPIETKDNNTPIYQKYVIKFSRISPRYIAEPPQNAFQSGGIFQYVLVGAEEKPTVKLLDVRMAQQIQDFQLRLQVYQEKNKYPPFKEILADNVYTIDYEKMGLKQPPTVKSPFSNQELSFVIDGQGEIFVDYTPDLYDALKKNKKKVKPGEDIRNLLVEQSDFVPAFSLPYTVGKDGKPIFLSE
nr:hypothetical protein [Bacillus massiliglaciei]